MRFVDSSFWIALRVVRDQNHVEASALWSELDGALLTTNHIIGETWTFLRRRAGHEPATKFLERVSRSHRLTIVHVDEPEEEAAWRWLRRHDERSYSLVDATSFVVMRRRRVREALAFDGDFSAAGFVEVRA